MQVCTRGSSEYGASMANHGSAEGPEEASDPEARGGSLGGQARARKGVSPLMTSWKNYLHVSTVVPIAPKVPT